MAREIESKHPKEKIKGAIRDAQDILDDLTDEWDKFYYDGKKKGGKNARKSTLELKKKAAEIRAYFKEVEEL